MREIEFRGKSKNSGRWVHGDLVTNKYQSRQGIHIYEKSNNVNCKSGYQFVRVDKKTLGQYTGLKDKNGTKIFEGDVAKCKVDIDLIVLVEWSEIMSAFVIREPSKSIRYCDLCFARNIEVIGNIYDNPELVNGE